MHNSSLNHTFRLVWSDSSQTYVAVAETTRGRGKGGRAKRIAAVVLAGTVLAGSAWADALPGAVLTGTNTVNSGGTSLVVEGSGGTGYFVQSGSLTIDNATLQNFSTRGGDGSGGGAGLGGAIFVNSGASVTLNSVNFLGNTVKGGDGGVGDKGGTLNNLFNSGSSAAQGNVGGTPPRNDYVDVGGTTGTKGAPGANNTTAGFGGKGGAGGNGGDGGNNSPPLNVAVASDVLGVAAWVAQLVADSANPFTWPSIAATGLNLANAVLVLTSDSIALDAFNKSIADGQIGLGGGWRLRW